jgi:hypothetical protein
MAGTVNSVRSIVALNRSHPYSSDASSIYGRLIRSLARRKSKRQARNSWNEPTLTAL